MVKPWKFQWISNANMSQSSSPQGTPDTCSPLEGCSVCHIQWPAWRKKPQMSIYIYESLHAAKQSVCCRSDYFDSQQINPDWRKIDRTEALRITADLPLKRQASDGLRPQKETSLNGENKQHRKGLFTTTLILWPKTTFLQKLVNSKENKYSLLRNRYLFSSFLR